MRKLERNEVEIVIFRRSRGNGGQHNNKTATACRMTHKLTGTRVEACKERSREANIKAAYKSLETKLDAMRAEETNAARRALYDAKPDASFGAKARTYHLVDRYVTDHVTGHKETNARSVLDGGIDGFIRASMLGNFA